MSNKKISALSSASTPLTGSEIVPINQSGVTDSVSVANLTAGRSVSASDYVMSTGNLVPSTAGKGINFTANTPFSGKTSQLLNWYEEGTWTPSVTSSGGSLTTVGTVSGSYTRIGRVINLFFNIAITVNGTGSGSILVANIPFIPNAANTSQGVFREQSLNGKMGSITIPNTSQIQLQFYDNSYPGANLTSFVGQITYYV